jgi:thiol-disulfide isomerase/thioredoxin
MKKLLLSLLICASATLNAQTSLTTAVDFTATDIDGNTFNLFNKLDSGHYVVIDFMFTTCGPCQATGPKLHGAFVNYGSNSPSSQLFFVSINRDDNNATMHTWETTHMSPTGPYPLGISGTQGSATAGAQTFHTTYGVGAFPTIILIAPNHQIIETDMWPISTAATFTTYFTSHGLFPTGINKTIKENNIFSISPIPATDGITINSKSKAMEQIKIMDMIGNVIYNERLLNQVNSQNIDISKLAAGIYFAEIRLANNEVSIQKFVKE